MAERDSKTALAELMYEDAEMRPLMDKWAEEKFPGAQAARASAVATAKAQQALDEKIANFDLKVAALESKTSRDRNIAAIKRDPNLRFTDAEIEPLEKFMLDRGIGNYEDAAYRYRQIHAVASPQTSRAALSTVDIPGMDEDNDGSYLKSAFTARGVNMSLVDKLTKKRVNTILADFEKDRIGAEQRWA